MQRIFCVNFSADGRFVISGSDDTNVRIWKAYASAPLCRLAERSRTNNVDKPSKRQEEKLDYQNSLKKKYAAFPEIRKIAR